MPPAPRILVIDDDEMILALTSTLLRKGGFDPVGVASTEAALALLQRDAFEVILTDLFVSSSDLTTSLNGIQSLRAAGKLTPVGVLTGAGIADAVAEAHGAAFVLHKPFSRSVLLEALSGQLALPEVPLEKQSVLRSYFASLERNDWSQLAKLCSPDIVYHLPGSHPHLSQTVRGAAQLVEVARGTFEQFVDSRFAITTMRPLPDGVLVRYDGSWRTPEGRSHLPGAILFRFEGNAIAEIDVRIDVSQLPAST